MKKILYWLLAILITVVLSVYQRMTGPTNPKRLTVELNGENYKLKFPRSGVQQDEVISLKNLPASTQAQVHYRRYPTNEEYTTEKFCWKEHELQAALPVQPIAGKLQYYITIDGIDYFMDEPLQIRFRNDVPASILVPHILFMFIAMLFAVYTCIIAVLRKSYKKWLIVTVVTFFIGGFILGPLMQHVAFGPWWTGFPFGTDLTDNKTLISFLFFVVALSTLKWKYNRALVILAALFMMVIFSIPHSTNGSEYDYSTQQLSIEK